MNARAPLRQAFTAAPAFLGALGCCLVLLAAKLWLIRAYGSDTPFWDQWDAEAARLFSPYLSGNLGLGALVEPHNEHRILTTRLLALALLELNGLWSPLLEMVVNAALHVTALLTAAWLLGRSAHRQAWFFLLVFTMAVFLFPFGWENTLSGFQSQFYFVLLFSLLSMWLLLESAPWSRSWLAGVALAVLAYFSLASGVFAVAAVVATCVVRGLGRTWDRRDGLALAVLLVLLVIGLAATTSPEYHKQLKATGLRQLLEAIAIGLAWPFESPLMGVVRNAPLLVLACVLLVQRPAAGDRRWLVFAVGAWGLAQTLALAYGRVAGVLASRYLDLHAMMLLANAAALLSLATDLAHRRWRLACRVGAGLWLVSTLLAMAGTMSRPDISIVLEEKRASGLRQTANLLQYLRSGDRAAMERLPLFDLPYPVPDRLAWILALPGVRTVLPSHLQPELAASVTGDTSVFVPGGAYPSTPACGCTSWGSYGPGGDGPTGQLLARYEAPAQARAPRIAFRVAGYPLRSGGITVEQDGRTKHVHFERDPGEQWLTRVVRVAPGPFVMRATDRDTRSWVAVTQAVPFGRVDPYVQFLLSRWAAVAALGGALVALSLLLRWTVPCNAPTT